MRAQISLRQVLLGSVLALVSALNPLHALAEDVPGDPTAGALKLDANKGEAMGGGKLTLLEGSAKAASPTAFSLEGLSVMQPVVITLLTRKPTTGVKLEARKPFSSTTEVKSATSNARGVAQLTLRAQGDVLVRVSGKDGTAYQLAIWVGPELRPPMASPFKPAKAEALRAYSGRKK